MYELHLCLNSYIKTDQVRSTLWSSDTFKIYSKFEAQKMLLLFWLQLQIRNVFCLNDLRIAEFSFLIFESCNSSLYHSYHVQYFVPDGWRIYNCTITYPYVKHELMHRTLNKNTKYIHTCLKCLILLHSFLLNRIEVISISTITYFVEI